MSRRVPGYWPRFPTSHTELPARFGQAYPNGHETHSWSSPTFLASRLDLDLLGMRARSSFQCVGIFLSRMACVRRGGLASRICQSLAATAASYRTGVPRSHLPEPGCTLYWCALAGSV